MLAKKTDKLKEMPKMPEEDFKTLLAIMLSLQPESSNSLSKCEFESLSCRKGVKKKAAKDLITMLKEKVILV